MQGTYVFAPSGRLLGRRNSNSSKVVLDLITVALEEWRELPAAEKRLADPGLVDAGFRWEDSYPSAGLVLRRTARDLPADGNPEPAATGRFNRDAIWFSKAEALSLVPEELKLGARLGVSEVITRRFSCLALVDNVRGQTIPFHPTEDVGSELWTEIVALSGSNVTIRIEGKTGASADGPWLFEAGNYWEPREGQQHPHSISTRVLGEAIFDQSMGRFTKFELIALGERRGRTVMQGRRSDEPGTIGFVCELAPEDWRIAPTFINVYDVDWVVEPGS
jgi:hypothetical protein